jgi:hypothetical protein
MLLFLPPRKSGILRSSSSEARKKTGHYVSKVNNGRNMTCFIQIITSDESCYNLFGVPSQIMCDCLT